MKRPFSSERVVSLLRKPVSVLTALEAADLAVGLGPAAPWLLRDDALRRLAEEDARFGRLSLPYRPQLSHEAGSCHVVYAVPRPGDFPLLRPAFLLPLRWLPGGDHDERLPAGLRRLADRIKRQLGLREAWSLHRLKPFDKLDLSTFDSFLEHDSGWAPLAGGLYLAANGGRPRPEVWATGCWDGDGGLTEVNHLPAKMELARAWGATQLFVPESQADAPTDGLQLGRLQTGIRAPADALREYRVALDAPPAPNDPQEERRRYYFRQPQDHPVTTAYYLSHFLPEIVTSCRRHIEEQWPGWAPTHLVTVVSGSPELILLTASTFGFRRCLLLYTKATEGNEEENPMRKQAEGTAQQLSIGQTEARCASFSKDDRFMAQEMWQHIEPFIAGVPDDDLVFDTTPGSKLMTLALEHLARSFRPRAWLLYLIHDQKLKRVDPLSERPLRWRAGDALFTNGEVFCQ